MLILVWRCLRAINLKYIKYGRYIGTYKNMEGYGLGGEGVSYFLVSFKFINNNQHIETWEGAFYMNRIVRHNADQFDVRCKNNGNWLVCRQV
jgi:hypothetical protein